MKALQLVVKGMNSATRPGFESLLCHLIGCMNVSMSKFAHLQNGDK